MDILIYLVIIVAGLLVGFAVGYKIKKQASDAKIEETKKEAEKIITDAKSKAGEVAKEAKFQAKDMLYKLKNDFERETKDRRKELQSLERRLLSREENIDKKVDILEQRQADLEKNQRDINKKEKELEEESSKCRSIINDWRNKIERIAGISAQEAKTQLIKSLENDAKVEAAKTVKQIEEKAKDEAEKNAKKIISLAIQRWAGDYVSERTVTVVSLPSDDMKGRIIGREGRNIRAIEAATGVDLIIDDTPEAVIISGFNPVRRHVARLALEQLIADGRIHPGRIEEVVQKVEQDVTQTIKEAGERAIFDLGIHEMHPELVRLIGTLKFRTSYTQNIYSHSLEVAFICGIIAAELGYDVKKARRAGLLHDIGKAVDHEIEGSHAVIGADIAAKYNEDPEIVHALRAHHEDVEQNTILDVIVVSADALSGARPGARREMLETYVKRLEELEKITTSFDGVERSFAIQAGREVRVLVEADKINDEGAHMISKDIAKRIENELTYPGQIKVTVIRETRSVEYAK